jgi:hypothetical protein
VPNGGHGDLFQVRGRDAGWDVVFLDPHPRTKRRERVLVRELDVAAALEFQTGATVGYDDPDGTTSGAGEYRAGLEVGRALRLEEDG